MNYSHYSLRKIFFDLTRTSVSVSTIYDTSNLTEGSKRTNIKPNVVVNQKFNNLNIFIV